MALWKPDQTFYPSARMAMQAPPEQLGYVVTFNPTPANGKHDALCVLDLDPKSKTYSQVIGRAEVPNAGDELHHFGWNACSAALCPYAPHPHIERRYLLVPGLRSSRIYIFDTKPDPAKPKLVKTIEADEIASRASWRLNATFLCPGESRGSALGDADLALHLAALRPADVRERIAEYVLRSGVHRDLHLAAVKPGGRAVRFLRQEPHVHFLGRRGVDLARRAERLL